MKSASRFVRGIQLSALALFAATLLVPQAVHGQDQTPATTPDNSGQNKSHATTADQQSEATQDRKIIAQNGSVTLKGPVKSDEEKQSIASKAAEIAGGPDKVTNQLTVTQP